ncbi:hypothetical protein Phi40:1_gp071 [Cellulophaga phage phi40:1]|uniref:Uncharacterized protein n=1 Tax=Cellulophaga phage phi38:1 TaxID=1327977 RepID=R9ZYA7_9CAUD|nr:hypothetical protein Phi38:1_gp071 [Cellulophaga phage phi38:1]AGO47936.1 hypothetical protein Phi40:1_gp071 [Cellulophaga phage phi40:1]AGO48101.1 hypothetical protein Phi38:1_gp071 [Cellulophaga phage phi38:1]
MPTLDVGECRFDPCLLDFDLLSSSKWNRNPPFQGVQCEFKSRR